MVRGQEPDCFSLRRRAAAAFGALVASFMLGLASPASAAGVVSLIEWDAPQGCAGALEVHARLSQLLGGEPETLGKLSRVRGNVLRTSNGYRLVLEAFEHDRRSSRLFEAASCDDLVDAAAIAIALAIAPEAGAPDENPDRAPDATHEPPALPPLGADVAAATGSDDAFTAERVDVTPGNASGPVVRGIASADALIEYGALPRATPGIAVGAGVEVAALSMGVYGTLLDSQTLRVAPQQTIELDLLMGGLRGCHALREAAPRLQACGSVEVGRFRALGLDLQQARQARDLWLAAGAAFDVRWPLSDALGIEFRAEPMWALVRKQYTINGTESVHAPAVLSSRLYIGLTFTGG